MTTTAATTTDVADALAAILRTVPDLRVESYASDATRPPAAVIGLPYVDYTDATAGFCRATWEFPVTLLTARNNDREAQAELARLLTATTTALQDTDPADHGLWHVTPLDARPTTVAVNGSELPAYALRVAVKA